MLALAIRAMYGGRQMGQHRPCAGALVLASSLEKSAVKPSVGLAMPDHEFGEVAVGHIFAQINQNQQEAEICLRERLLP